MIDYIHKDLYWQDSIDKQLKIELEDGTILDNSMIYSEEFELEESLCSDDELRFGACEASCVKFRIFSIPNRLVGQKITISEVLGGQTYSPMQIGKYKIASAKPTADRDFIDIVAYDVMYDIIHEDVAAWYNNQFKATTSTTTDEDYADFFGKLEQQYIDKVEKSCNVTAWIPELNKYVTQKCYVPDITPTLYFADGNVIKYNSTRIAFIGYGGKTR